MLTRKDLPHLPSCDLDRLLIDCEAEVARIYSQLDNLYGAMEDAWRRYDCDHYDTDDIEYGESLKYFAEKGDPELEEALHAELKPHDELHDALLIEVERRTALSAHARISEAAMRNEIPDHRAVA